jgi:NTP pyrophosphatase (non-canonical NTP hydrolase)
MHSNVEHEGKCRLFAMMDHSIQRVGVQTLKKPMVTPDNRARAEDELADFLLCLIRFADKARIDLQLAAEKKLALNAQKYPVEKFKGSEKKYDD